jgi:signal transduction histidine kinase
MEHRADAASSADDGAACATLGRSDHACLAFAAEVERLACAAAFLKGGLERGEQVVHVARDGRSDALDRSLEALGLPVREAVADGRLEVLPAEETYLGGGRFEPRRLVDWLVERTERAVRSGAAGLRVLGESLRAGAPRIDPDDLREYETLVDGVSVGRPMTLLCAYDRARLEPALVREALATHRLVVVDGRLRRSPFHVEPARSRGATTRRDVERMLDVVRRTPVARAARDAGAGAPPGRAVVEAQEAERAALARDLHDGLGESLASAHLAIQRALARRDDGSTEAAHDLQEADALLARAMEHVRRLAMDLRPPLLDDLGLAAALRSYARRTARASEVEVETSIQGLDDAALPPAVATAAFRVVQEALRNAVRHAGAGRVRVEVAARGGALEIEVSDDGRGFDVSAERARAPARDRLGLASMEERCALAGGALSIDSRPGSGTTVRGRLPL